MNAANQAFISLARFGGLFGPHCSKVPSREPGALPNFALIFSASLLAPPVGRECLEEPLTYGFVLAASFFFFGGGGQVC